MKGYADTITCVTKSASGLYAAKIRFGVPALLPIILVPGITFIDFQKPIMLVSKISNDGPWNLKYSVLKVNNNGRWKLTPKTLHNGKNPPVYALFQ